MKTSCKDAPVSLSGFLMNSWLSLRVGKTRLLYSQEEKKGKEPELFPQKDHFSSAGLSYFGECSWNVWTSVSRGWGWGGEVTLLMVVLGLVLLST